MSYLHASLRIALLALFTLGGLCFVGLDRAQGQYAPSTTSDPYRTSGNGAGIFTGGVLGRGVPGFALPSPMVLSERLWIRGEYLNWHSDGMESPILVTTSNPGTALGDAGVLDVAGTRSLFGGNLNDDRASGLRVRGGFWITPQQTFAIEAEYFGLLDGLDDSFDSRGRNEAIIARPFFDVGGDGPAQENAQVVRFPGEIAGRLTADVDTDLSSFLVNGRIALCPGMPCHPNGHRDRIDWIVGYRHIDLDDRVRLDESLSTDLGTLTINDRFATSNEFNGLQLGIVHQTHMRRLWLESVLRVAVGNNTQSVRVSGATTRVEDGETDAFNGGVFALPSNSGSFQREQFTLIPELGVTLGTHLTDWLDISVGYTVLYYPNVVRAGNVIPTDLNPGQFPPPLDPLTGASRPVFRFIESDYLAHGFSLGAELRF